MRAIRAYLRDFLPLLSIAYLALLGLLCVLAVQLYIGKPPGLLAGLLFMALIFGIYIFNRFTDVAEDFANDIAKYLFFVERTLILRLGIAAVICALIAFAALQKLRMYHILLVSLGVLYSYRLIPWYVPNKGFVFKRLKELPFIKNLIVSLLWGTAVFAIPMMFAGLPMQSLRHIYILIAVVAISTFSNTLFCDIRDEAGDRIAGTKTLVVLYGKTSAYVILAILNGGWIVAAAILAACGLCDARHFVFILVMALYPLCYIAYYHLPKHSSTILGFLCESDLLLFAAGLSILSIFINA
jgi:4-hydroxybenzoate polyprenyltransferase